LERDRLPQFILFTRLLGQPGNCGGISLLSVLCKIYSGILARRLRGWLINNKILSRFQAGFVKDKRTTDNIFVIKTTVDRYLRVKRSRIYWCLVELEKAFDSIYREALFKMRRKVIIWLSVLRKCTIPNFV
jgi:hypothetical protein